VALIDSEGYQREPFVEGKGIEENCIVWWGRWGEKKEQGGGKVKARKK